MARGTVGTISPSVSGPVVPLDDAVVAPNVLWKLDLSLHKSGGTGRELVSVLTHDFKHVLVEAGLAFVIGIGAKTELHESQVACGEVYFYIDFLKGYKKNVLIGFFKKSMSNLLTAPAGYWATMIPL